MTTLEKLAKHIKKPRKIRGISADKLAYSCGLSKTALSYIERCLKDPKLSTLEKIAYGLDVPLRELFNFNYAKYDKTERR
ncbi:MAG: helix-turn-helix transcriptional regulator [Candidatus Margulisbacteria bacterium]|jgi:transcriptional regulator with XRE-family HTH domain|nr:helix-turn-helix transcriptional regulator [Candidatus Margulisiibacteriota bacterium]